MKTHSYKHTYIYMIIYIYIWIYIYIRIYIYLYTCTILFHRYLIFSSLFLYGSTGVRLSHGGHLAALPQHLRVASGDGLRGALSQRPGTHGHVDRGHVDRGLRHTTLRLHRACPGVVVVSGGRGGEVDVFFEGEDELYEVDIVHIALFIYMIFMYNAYTCLFIYIYSRSLLPYIYICNYIPMIFTSRLPWNGRRMPMTSKNSKEMYPLVMSK